MDQIGSVRAEAISGRKAARRQRRPRGGPARGADQPVSEKNRYDLPGCAACPARAGSGRRDAGETDVTRRTPYSYRADAAVPPWDDAHGLIVYDADCVLCSRFVQFVLAHDPDAYFRFTSAQGPLGQALYRHYGLDTQDFETNLVIMKGMLHEKLHAFAAVAGQVGQWWGVLAHLRHLPRPVADWTYDRIAKNRYAMFGRRPQCLMPSALEGRYVD
jgi:predicted DCC family thiol-disulfide oxidoreductase YuxK